MKKVLVMNGANLNFLGIREKNIYGDRTLREINERLEKHAKSEKIHMEFFQSNYEGAMVEKIHKAITYPSSPKPHIVPIAISDIRDLCLNSSLLYMFER